MTRQEADIKLKSLPIKAVTLEGKADLRCQVAFPVVYNPNILVVVGMADTWDEAVKQADRHANNLTAKHKKKKKPSQPTLFGEE